MFRSWFRKVSSARVKAVWGEDSIWTQDGFIHWLQHPRVQARINRMIVGGFPGDRYQYFLKTWLDGALPVERALTLGCGSGELERGLHTYGFARAHEGVDLSEVAIRSAKEATDASGCAGLEYRTADLNTLELQPNRYDVAFGVSSVHHVAQLEHLFSQVATALRPNGLFFLDEYVGPNRFQWTDAQLEAMNTCLRALPARLRRRAGKPGTLREVVVRKTIAYMQEADPSEAVRSAEIIPILGRYFNIEAIRGYGGSLLHELLFEIAGNFDERDPEAVACLNQLFEAEDRLIASGSLTHDFAVIVARPTRPG